MPTKTGLAAAFVYFKLGFLSLSMTIGNKYLMIDFPYPNTLLIVQTFASVLFILAGIKTGRVSVNPITKQHLKIFLVPTVFKFAQLYSSLQAFPYVAVATVLVFRNLCTCIVAFLDGVVLKENLGKKKWLAVWITLLGVVVYAWKDINYDATGYFWLSCNTFFFTFNTIWNRNFISKTDQTTDGVNLIQQVFTVPLALSWAFYKSELKVEQFTQDISLNPLFMLSNLSATAQSVLALTSIGGCLIGATYAECYKYFPATQVTIVANVVKCLSILLDWTFFGTILAPFQSFGLLISICAGVWYTLLPKPVSALRKADDDNV
eukprot:maker-scaffold_63-snap-gene-0.8-mRNA-1 protein AED:0.22 eAED:0.22 QI:153/1/1/1/1/1/3/783/319